MNELIILWKGGREGARSKIKERVASHLRSQRNLITYREYYTLTYNTIPVLYQLYCIVVRALKILLVSCTLLLIALLASL
jgi:hypothetical protein